jgi:hypothetical protein
LPDEVQQPGSHPVLSRPQQKELLMKTTEPAAPAQSVPTAAARLRNGLGVAAFVIGVASLVAGDLLHLVPARLVGRAGRPDHGVVAFTRGRYREATNSGQAIAGVVCGVLALTTAVSLSVRAGTWAAHNANVFAKFDNCIAHAGNQSDVSICITRFANQRPYGTLRS